MISKNKVVTLNYILSENDIDGSIIENTYDSKAIEFIYGKDNMMPSFEKNIANLEEGGSFSFNVNSGDAYGEVNTQAIIDLDINMFKVNDQVDYDLLKVGNTVPMQDSKGNRMPGIVLEVKEEKVKFDFNHPLAGKDLFFKGEIIGIREATLEEIENGHLHSSCGCGSGQEDESSCCSSEPEEDSCGCGC